MKKIIVNTELIQVIDNGQEYKVYLLAKDGTKIEHEPFQRNLEGLVASLILSSEVNAGKFYLRGIIREEKTDVKLIGRGIK